MITAGGTVDGTLAEALGNRVKALGPFGGRTLIDIVLDACSAAGIADIAVVGGEEVRAGIGARARVIDAAKDGGTNVLRALDAWPGERFVYLTSDLPFITAQGLRDFLERSADYGITMALADVAAYEARFPGAPEHSVAFGGERVANGNAFVIGAEAVPAIRRLATRFFAARKSLLRMALLLGPALLVQFALKRLTIAGLERDATQRLGVPVAAVRGCDPGLCYDIDTLADYEYACAHAAMR